MHVLHMLYMLHVYTLYIRYTLYMLHVLYNLSIGSQCYICGTCYARCIISAIISSKCMLHVLHMLRPPIPAPRECFGRGARRPGTRRGRSPLGSSP